MNRFFQLYLISGIVILSFSCSKDKVVPDPRMKYVGDWNFKSNSYHFSGFYDYSGQTPVWTYTESSSTGYNDSTGSIRLGPNKNQIIIIYCSTCMDEIFDLNENGDEKWSLDSVHFFNNILPAPPGYNSSYSTYNVEGWKL